MSRENPNGEVVLYVEGKGTVVATADVARASSIHGCIQDGGIKVYATTLNLDKDSRYLVVGAVKKVPPEPDLECALKPVPYIIDEALKYTRTKFFRMMIDLMKLAQFDPFNNDVPAFGSERFLHAPLADKYLETDIDFSLSVPEIDAQLYRKYDFTPAMIDFVERKYSYDNGAGVPQQGTGEETRGSFHAAADDVSNGAHAGNARIADER